MPLISLSFMFPVLHVVHLIYFPFVLLRNKTNLTTVVHTAALSLNFGHHMCVVNKIMDGVHCGLANVYVCVRARVCK